MSTPVSHDRRNSLVAFIDGFNLYHGMHDKFGHKYLWLDLVRLVKLLRPQSRLEKVYYFTAPVLDDHGAISRQGTYLKALKDSHPDLLEIIEGRYQRKEQRCINCGATWTTYEEKETDVNTAVSLVAVALEEEKRDILVISADSDMAPAIRRIQKTRPGQFIVASFPPGRGSKELRKLMPASFRIGEQKLAQAQLPAHVTDPVTGHIVSRPAKWS